jgi:LacI family transcriptional regulator, galactose operon repressor
MDRIPIVILHIETSREYGRQLIYGIAKYSRLKGPWALYRQVSGLHESLPYLKSCKADGIITRDIRKVKSLIETGIPAIVSIHFKRALDMPIIITDDVKIGQMAAEHLLERGLRHFAFCGFDDAHWSEARKASFTRRIAEAGFETHVYNQPSSRAQRKWPQEQEEMVGWLLGLPKPIGVMACNDDRGQHVTEACKQAELNVPEEVAVVGVDNDKLVCELTDPPLSSVALSVEKAGYEAAELLDSMMKGAEPARKQITVHPMHVAARRSSETWAIEDDIVADALHFIGRNAGRAIQVDDVADGVCISRRALERRFRKVLGRSVYQQIRYERVERLAKMLTETNLPIVEIATALDFLSVEHVARVFRAVKGKSPRAYRKGLKGP